MAAFCPKCGKEIRTGGKFCGSCGHKLTSHTPGSETTKPQDESLEALETSAEDKPEPQDEIPSTAANGEINCPYCDQPIREGVQFCAHCGKKLEATPNSSPVGKPGIDRKPRIIVLGFLLGVILLMCISVIGIAWGFGWTDFIFSTVTATP